MEMRPSALTENARAWASSLKHFVLTNKVVGVEHRKIITKCDSYIGEKREKKVTAAVNDERRQPTKRYIVLSRNFKCGKTLQISTTKQIQHKNWHSFWSMQTKMAFTECCSTPRIFHSNEKRRKNNNKIKRKTD